MISILKRQRTLYIILVLNAKCNEPLIHNPQRVIHGHQERVVDTSFMAEYRSSKLNPK